MGLVYYINILYKINAVNGELLYLFVSLLLIRDNQYQCNIIICGELVKIYKKSKNDL